MSEVWFTCDVDAAMADRIEQCNQWNGQAISDAYGKYLPKSSVPE